MGSAFGSDGAVTGTGIGRNMMSAFATCRTSNCCEWPRSKCWFYGAPSRPSGMFVRVGPLMRSEYRRHTSEPLLRVDTASCGNELSVALACRIALLLRINAGRSAELDAAYCPMEI